jgi:hypothetical protein
MPSRARGKPCVIDGEAAIAGNRGAVLAIRSSTPARQLAEIALNDCRGIPGGLWGTSWPLSLPGELYAAVEEVQTGSGMVPLILSHSRRHAAARAATPLTGAGRPGC